MDVVDYGSRAWSCTSIETKSTRTRCEERYDVHMGPSQDPPPYTPLWPSFGISLTRNKIHLPVGWALSLGSKSGLSGLDFMYSGLPIGTAVGHFWLAFDCVGQAGRGLLFRVASNVFPPFPQSATEGPYSATTRKLKRPPEALMQQKLVQGT